MQVYYHACYHSEHVSVWFIPLSLLLLCIQPLPSFQRRKLPVPQAHAMLLPSLYIQPQMQDFLTQIEGIENFHPQLKINSLVLHS